MQYSIDKKNIDVDKLYKIIKVHTLYELNNEYEHINIIHVFIVINMILYNKGILKYISDNIFGEEFTLINRFAKVQ
jgi:hypothetical protein